MPDGCNTHLVLSGADVSYNLVEVSTDLFTPHIDQQLFNPEILPIPGSVERATCHPSPKSQVNPDL